MKREYDEPQVEDFGTVTELTQFGHTKPITVDTKQGSQTRGQGQ